MIYSSDCFPTCFNNTFDIKNYKAFNEWLCNFALGQMNIEKNSFISLKIFILLTCSTQVNHTHCTDIQNRSVIDTL